MTGFTDFPNELIVEVWRQVVDPKSVENFALTNKTIYALGGDFIEEHNELNFKSSSINHYQNRLGLDCPAESLKTWLHNPRAALYIRTVSIHGWRSEWEYPDNNEQARHRSYSEDTMDLFRHSIKNSPLNLGDGNVSWLNSLEAGNEGALFSLILTMFPNMQSLNLDHVYSADTRLLDTVKCIAESRDTEVLSRLTEVQLLPGDIIKGCEKFEWVRTFATVSSVKAIEAWDIGPDCDCCNPDYPNDDCISDRCGPHDNYDCCQRALLPKASAVTHLTFINCVLNTKKLLGFLEGLQGLQSFKYHSPREFPEPVEMVHALLANAKHTLRNLRLRSGGVTMRHAVTLADFDVMEELEIGYDLLLDHRGTNKVADMLPRSIKNIHLSRLYTNYHYDTVKDDVLEMTLDNTERLPNLKKLKIELDEINLRLVEKVLPICRKCTDVGVELIFTVKPPRKTSWSRSEVMSDEWRERRKSGHGFSEESFGWENRGKWSWTRDMFY